MPEFKVADYGLVGLVMLMIISLIWKLPEIIGSFRSVNDERTGSVEYNNELISENNKDTQVILQELSSAIMLLKSFLETEKAVDHERNKAFTKSLEEMLISIDTVQKTQTEVLKLLTEHTLKCEMTCHKR